MTENYSLWDRLATHDKPIVIYGTGNGADKIFDALEKYGVTPDAVFASDGFVRERTFRGYPVRSYSDVVSEHGDDIIILLAFGTTLPDVTAFIEELDARHELIIPEVPLYGGELFDMIYYRSHADMLEKTASVLSDEVSAKLFEDAVNFRLTGKLCYLRETEPTEETLTSLFGKGKIKTLIDGGAFKGDSTAIFADYLAPEKIYAIEADGRTYKKLCEYAESESRTKVIPVNAMLSSECGTTEYVSSQSRGSGENGRNRRAKVVEVEKKTIDGLIGDEKVDLIKLDVEGDEKTALDGALSVISRDKPSLAVSLYHRTDDLFGLILYVHALLPEHRLYLRRVPCIPMWDLMLYAVKQEKPD